MSSQFLYTLNMHNCSRLPKASSYIDSPAHTFDPESLSIHSIPPSFVLITAHSHPPKTRAWHALCSFVGLSPSSRSFLPYYFLLRPGPTPVQGLPGLFLRVVTFLDEADVTPHTSTLVGVTIACPRPAPLGVDPRVHFLYFSHLVWSQAGPAAEAPSGLLCAWRDEMMAYECTNICAVFPVCKGLGKAMCDCQKSRHPR